MVVATVVVLVLVLVGAGDGDDADADGDDGGGGDDVIGTGHRTRHDYINYIGQQFECVGTILKKKKQ